MEQIEYAGEVEQTSAPTHDRLLRAILFPISVFRANRLIRDQELLVDGKPADWTTYDQARLEKHRQAVEAAETVLTRARSEQSAPYSLASAVAPVMRCKIVSTFSLLGAVGMACAGAVIGILAAIWARQPDSVLLESAMKSAHEGSPPPSVCDERDFYLTMLGIGITVLILALYRARECVRALRR